MNILIGIATEQSLSNPIMGSERQTVGYSHALAGRGHTVYLVNILKDSPDWDIPYDVCHLINASGLKGPYMLTAEVARLKGIPVLMSPVYWPTQEVQREIFRTGLVDDKEQLAMRFSFHTDGVRKMLRFADWLLPNAEMEMDKVAELMDGEKSPVKQGGDIGYTVIRNGINIETEIDFALRMSDLKFDDSIEGMLSKKFVVCIGRVEARKNQYNLIQAMDILAKDDPELQLVLMGMKSTPYIKKIKEAKIGRHVLYCPPGPIGAMMKMMRRSIAHALPSFIETPGLVNLEAAALNRPIVVGDRGSVREYFYDLPGVFYCDPTNIEDMAEKIKAAIDFGEAKELGEFVRSTYSYEKIAEDLELIYKKVLRLHKH